MPLCSIPYAVSSHWQAATATPDYLSVPCIMGVKFAVNVTVLDLLTGKGTFAVGPDVPQDVEVQVCPTCSTYHTPLTSAKLPDRLPESGTEAFACIVEGRIG